MSDIEPQYPRRILYREIGEFWDSHDASDYWEQTEPVEFEVDIESEVRYYALEPTLATQVAEFARHKGISAETLLNLWVQEKIQEIARDPTVQNLPRRYSHAKSHFKESGICATVGDS